MYFWELLPGAVTSGLPALWVVIRAGPSHLCNKKSVTLWVSKRLYDRLTDWLNYWLYKSYRHVSRFEPMFITGAQIRIQINFKTQIRIPVMESSIEQWATPLSNRQCDLFAEFRDFLYPQGGGGKICWRGWFAPPPKKMNLPHSNLISKFAAG